MSSRDDSNQNNDKDGPDDKKTIDYSSAQDDGNEPPIKKGGDDEKDKDPDTKESEDKKPTEEAKDDGKKGSVDINRQLQTIDHVFNELNDLINEEIKRINSANHNGTEQANNKLPNSEQVNEDKDNSEQIDPEQVNLEEDKAPEMPELVEVQITDPVLDKAPPMPIPDSSPSDLINHINWNDLEADKRATLLDLNYYFNRIDKVFESVDLLKEQINVKYQEAEELIKNIERELGKLKEEEPIVFIDEKIDTLEDLISVAKKYGNPQPMRKFTVDVKILHKIIKPLEKLRDVIGLDKIKDQLVDQILTSLQSLYEEDLMFHTVIYGPPGVGKTMLARIIGEIYLTMGLLKANESGELNFKEARRSDLIGKYLGHTAVKTQEFIDKCEGGVLFIDEVYALGNPEKKDSFSKECIDTLNQNLTEKKNFICIIAGYPEEVEQCFFSYNPGLKRRFPFSYDIAGYTPRELRDIFEAKIRKSGWTFTEELEKDMGPLDKFIEKNMGSFHNFGGDVDTLITNSKIVHGRRIFGKDFSIRRKLTLEDITKGHQKMMDCKKKPKDDMDVEKRNLMYI